MVDGEAGVQAGIARHQFRAWRHGAFQAAEQDDLDDARHCGDQHQAEGVAQHQAVAVAHLDGPGEPKCRQYQQGDPVPDAGQPVAQGGDRAGGALRGADQAADRAAALDDYDAEEDVDDQPDRLQQRIVRGVGEAEQQADLGDGVADHADDDDAAGPTHGVGGGQVGDVQQAEAVVGGGEHHARDAEQCLAQRDGVDDREQDQPRQRVAAEGGCGDQVADGEEAEHGQQFERAGGRTRGVRGGAGRAWR